MTWLDRGAARRQRPKQEEGLVGAVGPALPAAAAQPPSAPPPPAASIPPAAPAASGTSLLYVATDLDSWETSTPEPDQDTICERCGYRRLTPRYYAWLRTMMQQAQAAGQKGELAEVDYEALRQRFNAVQAWAIRRFGKEALRQAVRTFDVRGYRPPAMEDPETARHREQGRRTEAKVAAPAASAAAVLAEHLHPADGDWRFAHSVTPAAVAQVDAVRDQALSLGWTVAGLYQSRGRYRFPAGDHYGLVCFLGAGDRIGEVSAQSIEIVAPSGTHSRVYNRDVPQPWIRPIPETPGPTNSDTLARVPVSNK
jgi:hypothetical protein